MSIHDIHVDNTSSTFARGAHLLAQTGKISRKYRRRQFDQTLALVRNSLVEILTCEKLYPAPGTDGRG